MGGRAAESTKEIKTSFLKDNFMTHRGRVKNRQNLGTTVDVQEETE